MRRHSAARRVRVALGATEEEIRVEVSDDGVGFDPRQTTEGVGLFAETLGRRAHLLVAISEQEDEQGLREAVRHR